MLCLCQGIAWVREREKDNGLVVLRLDQKDLLRKLEMVRFMVVRLLYVYFLEFPCNSCYVGD